MKLKKGYDFDDLLLVPRLSEVNNREIVDLSVTYKDLRLELPIIASPMRGIISDDLIIKLSNKGGIGILHRFFDSDIHKNYIAIKKHANYLKDNCKNWGLSVGVHDFYGLLVSLNPTILCIDVANGNLKSIRDLVRDVKLSIDLNKYSTLLMVGNVATYEGARALAEVGADLIRVGIGNGALCTTRNVTGVGVPQLTAIDNCKDIDALIVCDGGIRTSGDAVKALAMGADLVMMGTPFAYTNESENTGIIYGMASRKLQEEYYHSVKSVEGLERNIEWEKKRSLDEFISEFTWGMRSAFTYLNAHNIKELQKNATWIEAGTGSIKKL